MIGDSNEGKHPVVAVNDTREARSGTIVIRDADSGITLFASDFEIAGNGKTVVGYIPELNKQTIWLVDYSVGKEKYINHYLNGSPPFKLEEYIRWYNKLNIIRD
jgi:beta-mannosidase